MLAEKFLSLFRPAGAPASNGTARLGPNMAQTARPVHALPLSAVDRPSNGLRQFFENVRGEMRLSVLDLGSACQANINFIALRGHKLYTEDFLVALDRQAAGARNGKDKDKEKDSLNPQRVERFLHENLDYGAENFDGILVWDTLEFLDDELLAAVVGRLQAIVKSGGTLLAFFHTSPKGEPVPVYRYEIRNQQTLHLEPRFYRPLPRAFNNRNLERLFGNFHAVKFFLAKDGLREVIVTR